MSEVEVRPYPFDLTVLQKGSVIEPEEIERIGGKRRSDVKQYQLALLRVGSLLERQWIRERGERITVRQRGDALIICTDADAVGENVRRSTGHMRGLRRDHARQVDVNPQNLSEEGRDRLVKSLTRMSAFLAGGTRAVRATLKAYERKTPGLSSGG